VKDSCEKIQHFGAQKDETGTKDEPDDAVSLKKIEAAIKKAKVDYSIAEEKLRVYYGEE
jgi:osomolarity two-component system phosphorelay intermediate protein YPD1